MTWYNLLCVVVNFPETYLVVENIVPLAEDHQRDLKHDSSSESLSEAGDMQSSLCFLVGQNAGPD